jgi:hypothetical protein
MTAKARDFVDRNLMAIIAAGLAAYGGYITGQVTITTKIEGLEKARASHDLMHQRQRPFFECMVRHIDQIEGGSSFKPCPLALPE